MIRDLISSGTLAVAHRGDPLVKPQNTESAFRSALAYDIDMIETDINQTKDGVPVIIHDQSVDHLSDGTGLVADMTLAQIKKLDFGSWMSEAFAGERIMTLDELLELIGNTDVALNLEIKSGPIVYPKIAENALSRIHDHAMSNRVIISSFDHRLVKTIKSIDPKVMTAILYHAGLIDHIAPAKNALADGIHPEHGTVTGELIDAAKDAGLFVNTWTVDDAGRMRELRDMGVSGIISNLPALLVDTLKR
ncbi:MAG: glycerophosphodiester phosphodiesterase [Deltaproteobacteria bacterium]|nr:glycerophosphodiester phosphodiesterase [Candidatus Zymogenaceae bacterium]